MKLACCVWVQFSVDFWVTQVFEGFFNVVCFVLYDYGGAFVGLIDNDLVVIGEVS